MDRVAAIIQVRMTSTRLPGKVLMPILGMPMLAILLERLERAKLVDRIIIAATTRVDDDPIVELCEARGTPVFRGSEDDVLGRFHGAAGLTEAQTLIRVTGDCPLLDPAIVDAHVAAFGPGTGRYDYLWVGHPPRLPNGLGVEVFTRAALEAAHRNGTTAYEREHVTPYMRGPEAGLTIGTVPFEEDWSGYRLSVDLPEDFEVIRRIVVALYPHNAAFTLAETIAWLDAHPQVRAINAAIEQTTGPHARGFGDDR